LRSKRLWVIGAVKVIMADEANEATEDFRFI
jgi:hypothetical protein